MSDLITVSKVLVNLSRLVEVIDKVFDIVYESLELLLRVYSPLCFGNRTVSDQLRIRVKPRSVTSPKAA